MKRIVYFLAITLLSSAFISPSLPLEKGENKLVESQIISGKKQFQQGEELTYLAHYGFVNAAKGIVSLDTSLHTVEGRPCYKVDIDAKTVGTFSWAFDVKNLYRSFIDTAEMIPRKFYRSIAENKYRLEETVWFDHENEQAKVKHDKKGKIKTKEYEIPQDVQDIVSGYYYMRTLNFEGLEKGDTIRMDAFFEDELYDFKILYQGKDRLRTKFGKLDVVRLTPLMKENKFFRGSSPITMWVSDDVNRVPLKVRAKIFVGAFEIELIDYKGLKQNLSKD